MVSWRKAKRGGKFGRIPWWLVGISTVGTVYGLSVLLRSDKIIFDVEGTQRIVGKTVLITGANSGLGLETSKELAKRGGRILMACRDPQKCEAVRKMIIDETNNPSIFCYEVDLSSIKSIHDLAENIKANEKRLDILINNAGVLGVPESITMDGFETHLGVNYLGPFLLTNLLLGKMKDSASAAIPARILNITSHSHIKFRIHFKDLNMTENYSYQDAYAQSKLALIYFTQELADRYNKDHISAYAVCPKTADTALGRHLKINNSISYYILKPLTALTLVPAKQAINTIIKCAVDPDVAHKSGEFWTEGVIAEAAANAYNPDTQARLWIVSEYWTRLKTK